MRVHVYVIERCYIGVAEVALPLIACVSRELKLGWMNIRFPRQQPSPDEDTGSLHSVSAELQCPSSQLTAIGLPDINTVVVGLNHQ